MNILKELYYGNLVPCERYNEKSEELSQTLEKLAYYEKTLVAILDSEQKELFEKYQLYKSKLICIEDCQSFEFGFKMGAKIMAELEKEE